MKCRRLYEHSDDGVVHPDRPWVKPHDILIIPEMRDDPNDDHEREEDVERKRDRKERIAEADERSHATGRLCTLVDENDPGRCNRDAIREY